MVADLPPLHHDLTFLSPLSSGRADRLAGWLAAGLTQGGTALDVGCGWGELLLRVADAAPRARVVGLDLDAESIAEARRRAAARGVQDRATFSATDASTGDRSPVEAVLVLGASQVWGPDVEEGLPLDYRAALTAIRARLVPGGRLVYGEAIWSHSPTPEATAPLSGREDEFLGLADLVDLAVGSGFAVVGVQEATLDEWDEFESGFTAGYAHWLAEHAPDHPDADAVRALADRQRNGYLRGYRGILGMAYLQLIAV